MMLRKNAFLFFTFSHSLALWMGNMGVAFSQSNSGFIIKFKEEISYEQQQKIISGFPELILLEEKENSLLPEVSLAKFNSLYLTEREPGSEVKTELEKFPEIIFVNPFIAATGGHFAAPLGEFYVKLFSKNEYKKLEEIAIETRTKILREYEYMPDVFILFADKNSLGNSKAMAKYFSEKKLFRYASSNMMFSLDACTNDPLFNRQWAIKNVGGSLQYNGTPGADMKVDSAWAITMGDSAIKVAVLDSGVDTAHQDLLGNLLPGFDATGGGSNGYPNLNYKEDGHGTCCAGIIAAVANNSIGIAGVAPNCKIIPVKMFYYINVSGQPVAYSTNQWGLDAINWAWQTANADVMSNSWGIPDSLMGLLGIDTVVSNDAINNAVTNGRNGKGTPLLFSAGNEPDTFVLWPARTPATIAVAATTMCDELKTMNDCSPESFWASNHGTGLDISAPGVKIASTDITGSEGFASGNYYLIFNGTSAACPNAAGVMALILSANSNLTAVQAREIISSTCDKAGGYNYNVNAEYGTWSMELGYGRVNALKALQNILGINERKNENDFGFEIFPNPNDGKFLVRIANGSEFTNSEFAIYNLLGEKIYSEKILNPKSLFLNLNISKGIYFVKIIANEKVYCKKIVIEK